MIAKKNLSKIIKNQKGFMNTQNLKMMGTEFKEVFANKKYQKYLNILNRTELMRQKNSKSPPNK